MIVNLQFPLLSVLHKHDINQNFSVPLVIILREDFISPQNDKCKEYVPLLDFNGTGLP